MRTEGNFPVRFLRRKSSKSIGFLKKRRKSLSTYAEFFSVIYANISTHSFGHNVSAPGAGWQFPYNGTRSDTEIDEIFRAEI